MTARATFTTSKQRVGIDGIDDLTDSLRWFASLLPQTAEEELAKEQARGNLLKPIVIVDGRKGKDEDTVKPFGNITYVEGVGPMREAIAAADAFVRSAAPRRSGFYAESLTWFANGRRTGSPPAADKVGLAGNVQLIDLAPYASMVEIDVPRGVIFGAYTMLVRQFGRQLSIAYSYVNPDKYGGLREPPGKAARVPYAVPVLTIGNPSSSVKPGIGSRPGAHRRRAARKAARAAKKAGGA
jgi:hypothetical protein